MERASPLPADPVPRKFFRKYLPSAEAVLAKRWAAPFRPWLVHPNLWHLNRRSVPGALAIGLFAGLVPGPVQMLTALAISLLCKKNIPVALATTLYTNPFTIVPLYVLAYWLGTLALGVDYVPPPLRDFGWEWMASLGKPLAVGVLVLALGLAALGYLAAQLAWRAYVSWAWRARARRRRAPRAG